MADQVAAPTNTNDDQRLQNITKFLGDGSPTLNIPKFAKVLRDNAKFPSGMSDEDVAKAFYRANREHLNPSWFNRPKSYDGVADRKSPTFDQVKKAVSEPLLEGQRKGIEKGVGSLFNGKSSLPERVSYETLQKAGMGGKIPWIISELSGTMTDADVASLNAREKRFNNLGKGFAEGIASVGVDMSSPANIAMLAASFLKTPKLIAQFPKLVPIMKAALSGKFSLDALSGLSSEFPKAKEAMAKGDTEAAGKAIARSIADAFFLTQAVKGGARDIKELKGGSASPKGESSGFIQDDSTAPKPKDKGPGGDKPPDAPPDARGTPIIEPQVKLREARTSKRLLRDQTSLLANGYAEAKEALVKSEYELTALESHRDPAAIDPKAQANLEAKQKEVEARRKHVESFPDRIKKNAEAVKSAEAAHADLVKQLRSQGIKVKADTRPKQPGPSPTPAPPHYDPDAPGTLPRQPVNKTPTPYVPPTAGGGGSTPGGGPSGLPSRSIVPNTAYSFNGSLHPSAIDVLRGVPKGTRLKYLGTLPNGGDHVFMDLDSSKPVRLPGSISPKTLAAMLDPDSGPATPPNGGAPPSPSPTGGAGPSAPPGPRDGGVAMQPPDTRPPVDGKSILGSIIGGDDGEPPAAPPPAAPSGGLLDQAVESTTVDSAAPRGGFLDQAVENTEVHPAGEAPAPPTTPPAAPPAESKAPPAAPTPAPAAAQKTPQASPQTTENLMGYTIEKTPGVVDKGAREIAGDKPFDIFIVKDKDGKPIGQSTDRDSAVRMISESVARGGKPPKASNGIKPSGAAPATEPQAPATPTAATPAAPESAKAAELQKEIARLQAENSKLKLVPPPDAPPEPRPSATAEEAGKKLAPGVRRTAMESKAKGTDKQPEPPSELPKATKKKAPSQVVEMKPKADAPPPSRSEPEPAPAPDEVADAPEGDKVGKPERKHTDTANYGIANLKAAGSKRASIEILDSKGKPLAVIEVNPQAANSQFIAERAAAYPDAVAMRFKAKDGNANVTSSIQDRNPADLATAKKVADKKATQAAKPSAEEARKTKLAQQIAKLQEEQAKLKGDAPPEARGDGKPAADIPLEEEESPEGTPFEPKKGGSYKVHTAVPDPKIGIEEGDTVTYQGTHPKTGVASFVLTDKSGQKSPLLVQEDDIDAVLGAIDPAALQGGKKGFLADETGTSNVGKAARDLYSKLPPRMKKKDFAQFLWAVHPQNGLVFHPEVTPDTTHAQWFEDTGLPASGDRFDRIPRGFVQVDPYKKTVSVASYSGSSAPREVTKMVKEQYPQYKDYKWIDESASIQKEAGYLADQVKNIRSFWDDDEGTSTVGQAAKKALDKTQAWWVGPKGEVKDVNSGKAATHGAHAKEMLGVKGSSIKDGLDSIDKLLSKGWIRVRDNSVDVRGNSTIRGPHLIIAADKAAQFAKYHGKSGISVETDIPNRPHVMVPLTEISHFLADPAMYIMRNGDRPPDTRSGR